MSDVDLEWQNKGGRVLVVVITEAKVDVSSANSKRPGAAAAGQRMLPHNNVVPRIVDVFDVQALATVITQGTANTSVTGGGSMVAQAQVHQGTSDHFCDPNEAGC